MDCRGTKPQTQASDRMSVQYGTTDGLGVSCLDILQIREGTSRLPDCSGFARGVAGTIIAAYSTYPAYVPGWSWVLPPPAPFAPMAPECRSCLALVPDQTRRWICISTLAVRGTGPLAHCCTSGLAIQLGQLSRCQLRAGKTAFISMSKRPSRVLLLLPS